MNKKDILEEREFAEVFRIKSLEEEKREREKEFDESIPTGFFFSSGRELRFKRGGITLISSMTGYGQTSVLTTFAINEAIRNRDRKTGEISVFVPHEEGLAGEVSIMLNNYIGISHDKSSKELRQFYSEYLHRDIPFLNGTLPNGITYKKDFDKRKDDFFDMIHKGGTLLVTNREGAKLHIDELAGFIEFAAKKRKASSVFIDNLDLRFISSNKVNNSMLEMDRVAKDYNVAVICAHHLTSDGKLYEERELIYDSCIAVHLLKKREKEVMYAKVFRDWYLEKYDTALWGWIGCCKKITPNID